MLLRNAITCFLLLAISGAVLRSQQSRSVTTTTMGYPAVSNNRNPIPNTNAVLYYNRNKLERPKLNAVVNDKVLVGWEPVITDFENPPANTNANAPKPDLSRHIGDAWAFYYMGRLIASGTNAPTPDELQRAFENSGAPNKIPALKRFLLQNPANLNARLELMRELDRHAFARTRRALSLTPRDARTSILFSSIIAPEIEEYLSPEDDANIWGDLAALFSTAFNTEEWLSFLPDFYYSSRENMAVYSPSMKAVYQRNISKVEKALEERQTDTYLWRMWQEMAQVTGIRTNLILYLQL